MASLGTGIIIGFIYSWQLTLLVLGFVPFLMASGAIQMKVITGQVKTSDKAMEDAGKVLVLSLVLWYFP